MSNPPIKVLYLCNTRQPRPPVSSVLQSQGGLFQLTKVDDFPAFEAQVVRGGFDAGLIDFRSLPTREAERLAGLGSLASLLPLVLLVSEREEVQALKYLELGMFQDYVVKSLPQVGRLPFAIRNAVFRRAGGTSDPITQQAGDIERRFLSLLKHGTDALVVIGVDGEIKFQTDAVARVLGYTANEMNENALFGLVHPGDLGGVLRMFSELTHNMGGSVTGELRLRAKDGSWCWMEATAKNLLEDPLIGGIVVNYHIIHERKQADLLQDAVYRIARAADLVPSLEELFPRIHAIISEVMPAGNFYIALAGSTQGYLTFPYFVDEVDPPPLGEQAENGLTEYVIRTGRPLNCDENMLAEMIARGEVNDVGASSRVWLGVPLVVDGVVIGAMVVQHYQDSRAYGGREQRILEFVSSQVALVIKKKQVEEVLRSSEARFRSLFDGSTVGIMRTTPDGRVLLANPALIKMLHFDSLKELQQRDLRKEGFAPEQPRSEFINLIEAAGELHGYESTWISRDGLPIHVRESTRAVRNPDGKTMYYEGIVEDITKQKQVSQSLQEKVTVLQALAEIDRDILAARRSGDILELVCRSAALLLKTPMAAIVATQGGDWRLEAAYGIELSDRVLPEMYEVLTRCVDAGTAGFNMQDILVGLPTPPEFFTKQGIRSILAENLSTGVIQSGILLIFDVAPRVWSEEEAGLLKALAGQAAIALEKARLLADAERRGDEFAALYDISMELSGERDLRLILSRITDSVSQSLNVPSAFIYLYDETRELLTLSITKGHGYPPGLTVKLGEGMAGQVAASRKQLLVRDYHSWQARLRTLEDVDYSSILEVPMLFSGMLIGVLGVAEIENKSRVFAEQDARLLSLFAGQAASAVYNARLFDAIRRSNQELDRLYRASDALIGAVTANVSELSQKIAQIVISEFQHSNCSLWLIPKDSNQLQRGAIVGAFSAEFVERTLPLDGSGLIPKAVRTAQVVNSPDVLADPDYLAGWSQARSELVLPLKSGERVIGALDIQSTELADFEEDDVRMMSQFASRASLMLEHARLASEMEQNLHRLSALHTVDIAVASSLDLQVTLKVFLEQVTSQLRVDAADVLLINPHLHLLEYAAGRGFRGVGIGRVNLMVGEDAAGQAALERRVIGIPNLGSLTMRISRPERIAGEGFTSLYAVPLLARGQVKGVLELYFRNQFDADLEWENFVETLARQAALAIDDAHLVEQLQRSYADLAVAYDSTIEGWAHLLELRGIEPQGHSHYVTGFVIELAQRMGVQGQDLAHLYRGSLLHDIGNLAIPDAILRKPGPLTDEERDIVRTHVIFAKDFMFSIEYLRPAADIPYAHHEKWDGSGYPRGLKGEQIPLAARIFSVVDVWDTLKRDLPHRPAKSEVEATAFIRARAGQDFDPQIVELFLDLLREEAGRASSAQADKI